MVSSINSFSAVRSSDGRVAFNVDGASDANIKNIGRISGSASFMLSETSEGAQATVFDVMQTNANRALSIDMFGNNNNTRFSGYNIDAAFNQESDAGYNVEINTINSKFDFSGNSSGAHIYTTYDSAYNLIGLGGGSKYVHNETIDGALTAGGTQSEKRYFNNLVSDSGYSNVFLSSDNSITKFETTADSYGAFFSGGNVGDVVNIGGSYGVFRGGDGYNIFTTSEFKNEYDSSMFNVVFGGLGYNVYNDFGMKNMYQGAYAQYENTSYAGINGADTIRMNGSYGIARVSAENALEEPEFTIGGKYNMAFTGDSGTIDGETFSREFSYHNALIGMVGEEYRYNVNWTVGNFYSSNKSPSGYSAILGSQLLGLVMDEV